jgi:hypothetical protein
MKMKMAAALPLVAAARRLAPVSRAAVVVVAAAAVVVASAGQPAVAAPSGRAYELVSVADSRGEDLKDFASVPRLGSVPRSSAEGDAALYSSDLGLLNQDEGGWINSYRATRGPTGWTSRYVGPPGTRAFRGAVAGASPDFSEFIVGVLTGRPLDPTDNDPDMEARDVHKYYRRDASGAFTLMNTGSDPAPLVLDPLTGATPSTTDANDSLVAHSEDLSRLLFYTGRRREPGPTKPSYFYLRDGAHTVEVTGEAAGEPLEVEVQPMASRPASSDLETIYFTGRPLATDLPVRVYLWRGPDEPPLEISASRRTPPAPQADVTLLGVSDDGTSALIVTTEPLTDDDTDAQRDIYRYSWTAGGDPALGTLSRLTAGPLGGNSAADAHLVGASTNQDVMYFTSAEALAPGASSGAPNLYVRDPDGTRLVAALLPDDAQPFVYDNEVQPFGMLAGTDHRVDGSDIVRVTGDGRRLAFVSHTALGGAQPAGQLVIYRYDANTGDVQCISCRPDGTAATSDSWFGLGSGRGITANGSDAFFQTAQALLPGDSNGRDDVYGYDAATGSLSLISSGTSESPSTYYDNSADGRDVFFMAREALVAGDRNGDARRLYDARIGGGFPEPSPAPACSGDECLGRPSPAPVLPGAASSAFGPSGNVRGGAPVFHVGDVGARQRKAWARTGRLTLRVRLSEPGGVSARATARIGKRVRTVSSTSRTAGRAGTVELRLTLSRTARRRLQRQGRLRVTIAVRFSRTAGTQRATLTLRRARATTKGDRR